MNSPIRYFGGKGGMYKKIIECFPKDIYSSKKTCSDGSLPIYIEAFGGSASILFHKHPSPIEIYNDLESNVYSLFKVLSDKKKFLKFRVKCENIYYSRRLFDEFSESLKNEKISELERAFRFFYVNRVAYNGVGGFSNIVNYVRRGMSKPISDMLSTIDRLPEIHNRLKTVIIENKDAIELIRNFDRKEVFFYLDPPYHHSTRTKARYDIDMDDSKQEELIDTLLGLKKSRVLLSGYECQLYNKLTNKKWEKIDFNVITQTGQRKSKNKTESLWRNY